MKTAVYVIGFFTLLSMAGCRKGDDEDKGPLDLPKAILDYTYFQPGTYWVYIDSVSGRVDSVYVYKTLTGYDTLQLFDYPSRAYQWIETRATSAMDGYDYIFYSSTSYSVKDESKVPVYVVKQKIGHYAGKGLLFVSPAEIDDYYYNGNGMVIVNNLYDSLLVNSYQYKNLIEIFYDKSPTDISNNITKYISQHFGIIRKEYADSNQVWNLARSNIIQ